MKGRDRNKPCFCGSGLKYKHCHYYTSWLDKVDPIESIGKMPTKKKIAIWGNSSGAFYWRLFDPYTMLNGRFDVKFPDGGITEEMAQWADVYVLQGCVNKDGIAMLHAYQKEQGKKIVVDVDDLIELADDNPHQIEHQLTNASEVIKITLGIADLVTTTTPYLAEKLKEYNKNVFVFPNYMNMHRWDLPTLKNTSDRVRIGWAGSITHLNDIKMIQEPLQRVLNEFSNAQLVLVGDPRMKDLFTGNVEVMLGVPFDSYPTRLHGLRLDIGLAPLVDNEFNRCKSNIKWMEYSIAKTPGVFSRHVYWQKNFEDKLGFIADTQEQWYHCIRNMVVAKQLRDDIADSAYSFVKTHYDLENHVHELGGAIDSIYS